MTSKNELKAGGLLLSLGALLTIVCILLEINAGWASLWVEMTRSDYEADQFLYDNWETMSPIWTWSMFGNVLLAAAALLLMKNADNIGWFPLSLLWAMYFIGTLVLVVAFAISVGSYFQALEVLDNEPAVFMTIRGAALFMFNIGLPILLLPLILFFYQGFKNDGWVPRSLAITAVVLIIGSLLTTMFGLTSFAVFAISIFLTTAFLGVAYMRISLAE